MKPDELANIIIRQIADIEYDNLIHDSDYWCDAYISSATLKCGRDVTEEEFDILQDSDVWKSYEQENIHDYLY